MVIGVTVKNYTKFYSVRASDPLPLRGCPPKGGRIRSHNEFTDILRINPPLGGQGGQYLYFAGLKIRSTTSGFLNIITASFCMSFTL